MQKNLDICLHKPGVKKHWKWQAEMENSRTIFTFTLHFYSHFYFCQFQIFTIGHSYRIPLTLHWLLISNFSLSMSIVDWWLLDEPFSRPWILMSPADKFCSLSKSLHSIIFTSASQCCGSESGRIQNFLTKWIRIQNE